jgi:hypothetical protein
MISFPCVKHVEIDSAEITAQFQMDARHVFQRGVLAVGPVRNPDSMSVCEDVRYRAFAYPQARRFYRYG